MIAASPIRLEVAAPPLVRAGIDVCLRPFEQRVVLASEGGGADVGLVVPPVPMAVVRRLADAGRPRVVLTDPSSSGVGPRWAAASSWRILPITIEPPVLVDELETLCGGSGSTRPTEGSASPVGLSAREVEVLRLICAGASNREIASALFLSIDTVKSCIKSTYRKIGATRRVEAVLWGLEHAYQL